MPHVSADSQAHLLEDYSPYNEKDSYYPTRHQRTASSRRRMFATCASLAAVAVTALLFTSFWTSQSPDESVVVDIRPSEDATNLTASSPPLVPAKLDPLDPLASLKGDPTSRFQDNLLPELKYITSWISAGWTNDVMTYGNLIYLALITDRIPVLAMFTPSHIGGGEAPIAFGDVFDVPRLRQLIGKPVLEWREVKDSSSDVVDDLGCWNIWEVVQDNEKFPRRSSVPDRLKIDVSYTKAPASVKLYRGFEHDSHATFWNLATLAFPETRKANLVTPLPSPLHQVSLPPDEQMLCYDYLYYVCAHEPYEWDKDYSPAWRYVGQHMRWTKPLEDLAEMYVRETLAVPPGEVTPPWITIHVRHGDFAGWCGETPLLDCFAPISVIAKRVEEVKAALLVKKGVAVKHVIMTSDERDPSWWSQVDAQRWYKVDHSKTKETFGPWYPVLIDAVIQSNGLGFVGTDRSTMTIMAHRRVESWHDGVSVDVKWGNPHADDH
ncbi:hypothetical protein HGRIS_008230 [Hohenbuehelia grisea]|uniref:Uncharacterized protein n=1 Tax=Hohenbuehelia grisea TaxID=104357 RepID=A0ABR3J7I5_9AGAR